MTIIQMIKVVMDINALVDLVRGYGSLEKAKKAGASQLFDLFIKHGNSLGIQLETGPHFLKKMETVLIRIEGWGKVEAREWRELAEQAVIATGGSIDNKSDLTMHGEVDYVVNRNVPDDEDANVLRIAELVGAHYLVTADNKLAQVQTRVRFCPLNDLVMQVNNTVRRITSANAVI